MATALHSEATSKRTSPPHVIAKAIGKAVTARKPRTRYALGFGAKPMLFLRRWLPDRAFDALIRRATGIH
jgi:hypothetical protein